jgi:hypothetical protein
MHSACKDIYYADMPRMLSNLANALSLCGNVDDCGNPQVIYFFIRRLVFSGNYLNICSQKLY